MNDAWIEVDQGRQRLDWAVCFGDLNEADYLTPAGREAGSRAVDDLEAFFGADWLHRATNLDPSVRPNLPPFWPSLMKAPAFVAAIGLWARLQMLVVDRVEGIGKLRRNLRANPVRDEFRHGIAQARLSVQAMLAGARVVIEPTKPGGGPGDLLAVRAGTEVFIEFRGLNPDDALISYEARVHAASMYLRRLETRHAVYWSGDLPEDPTEEWRRRAEDAAAHAAEHQVPVELVTDRATLVVRPGTAPVGNSLAGPRFETDHGHRLMSALTKKAISTTTAGAAWIWLEDDRALWPLADFVRNPLPRKIDILTEALAPLFQAYPHVLGVVLTSHPMRLDGPVEPATEERRTGTGHRRTLPDGLVRESLVVHRPLVVPGQYALVRQLCADEPAWLDGALARLGIPGGLASLTTWAQPAAANDATPHRSPAGLYLPSVPRLN